MFKSLAHQFVSSPCAWETMEAGTQHFGDDDNALVEFSDGSFAVCLHGIWTAGIPNTRQDSDI